MQNFIASFTNFLIHAIFFEKNIKIIIKIKKLCFCAIRIYQRRMQRAQLEPGPRSLSRPKPASASVPVRIAHAGELLEPPLPAQLPVPPPRVRLCGFFGAATYPALPAQPPPPPATAPSWPSPSSRAAAGSAILPALSGARAGGKRFSPSLPSVAPVTLAKSVLDSAQHNKDLNRTLANPFTAPRVAPHAGDSDGDQTLAAVCSFFLS